MSEKLQLPRHIRPARFQAPLPADRLILRETPDPEAVPMDVVFVGGGPAGLAGAIELARLVGKDNEGDGGLGEVEIGVLEKASQGSTSAGLEELGLSAALPVPRVSSRSAYDVIALGASTGGPEALETVLRAAPRNAPGMVVVQHMPKPFTGPFAKRLNSACEVEVREATDGASVLPGLVLVAPGDQHVSLAGEGPKYWVKLADGPLVSRHRPSIDMLFHSVAKTAGQGACGVLMTGMGTDGVEGLLSMKGAGAATVGQDESTSVVFGMAKKAIERGAVGRVLPVSRILPFLLARR